MRKILTLAALLGLTASALAQSSVYVRPHFRSDGTFVEGHRRTVPDGRSYNNWSSTGNVNPYTGRAGSVDSYGTSTGAPRYYPVQPIPPVRPIEPIPPVRSLY